MSSLIDYYIDNCLPVNHTHGFNLSFYYLFSPQGVKSEPGIHDYLNFGSAFSLYQPNSSTDITPFSNASPIQPITEDSSREQNSFATSSLIQTDKDGPSNLLLQLTKNPGEPQNPALQTPPPSTLQLNTIPEPCYEFDISSSVNSESIPCSFDGDSRDSFTRPDQQIFSQYGSQGFQPTTSRSFYQYPNTMPNPYEAFASTSDQTAFQPYLRAMTDGSFYSQPQSSQYSRMHQSYTMQPALQAQAAIPAPPPPKSEITHKPMTRSQNPELAGTSCKRPSSDLEVSTSSHKKARFNTYNQLDQKAVAIMEDWYSRHQDRPYPTKREKHQMATEGGITETQVRDLHHYCLIGLNHSNPRI